jgi:hypothetical protein
MAQPVKYCRECKYCNTPESSVTGICKKSPPTVYRYGDRFSKYPDVIPDGIACGDFSPSNV